MHCNLVICKRIFTTSIKKYCSVRQFQSIIITCGYRDEHLSYFFFSLYLWCVFGDIYYFVLFFISLIIFLFYSLRLLRTSLFITTCQVLLPPLLFFPNDISSFSLMLTVTCTLLLFSKAYSSSSQPFGFGEFLAQ